MTQFIFLEDFDVHHGVPSGEAFGTLIVAGPISPDSIPSGEAFGSPKVFPAGLTAATGRITFADDVIWHSTASNFDGTVRWHVYEKQAAGSSTIFVQRQILGQLEPEIQLLTEGARPRVSFDIDRREFHLHYQLQENTFFLRWLEQETLATQPAQIGDTSVDHFSGSVNPDPGDFGASTVRDTVRKTVTSLKTNDATSGPQKPLAVSVGASKAPNKWVARWILQASQVDVRIVGFNIWVRRLTDGAIVQANAALVPFQALATAYEADIDQVPGAYFVTTVERTGTSAAIRTKEGRISPSVSGQPFIGTDLRAANDTIMEAMLGEGRNLVTIKVDNTPIQIPSETSQYKDAHVGEGFNFLTARTLTTRVLVPAQTSQYKDAHVGEGRNFSINRTGTGGIIIG